MHTPNRRRSGPTDAARVMGLVLFAGALVFAIASLPAVADERAAEVQRRIAEALQSAPHPRLFLGDADVPVLKRKITDDKLLARAYRHFEAEAKRLLQRDPVARKKTGRRLLSVSRDTVRRINSHAFVYRLTGMRAHLDAAQREMLAAATFSDWNPSHFLDVAEMTAALAVGYDWLYDELDPDARETIRRAIVEKGLQTSFKHAGWWVKTTNNWNQVCHGGLVLGALAVMEDEPQLARRIIQRALDNIHRAMDVYGPNGAYPEGPGYWAYGTTYNVLLIDALQSALGSDFGLTNHTRFMRSARYYLHAHGPTLRYFNYCDCSEGGGLSEAPYWFARVRNAPELLWLERRNLANRVAAEPGRRFSAPRWFALMFVWAPAMDQVRPPAELHFAGGGPSPIGVHRSDWSPTATYVGLKAGSPRVNHGHMDIGSFVMAADGVRWAVDLGAQNYHSLESRGLNLWNGRQDGERWTVFRLNNVSHNTLVVDGRHQRVNGHAEITRFTTDGTIPHTVIDMGAVYAGQLAAARRGVGLLDNRVVVVRDELRTLDRPTEVRWAMVTRAEVKLNGPRATLSQQGKTLELMVLHPRDTKLQLYSTDPSKPHDATNPGTRMVGFSRPLQAETDHHLTVLLIPGGTKPPKGPWPSLDDWAERQSVPGG